MEKGIGTGNRFEKKKKRFISVFMASGSNKDKSLATAADHLISSRLFRSLQNRYDLDKANITKFKDDYIQLFSKSFNQNPILAIELLDIEIRKK